MKNTSERIMKDLLAKAGVGTDGTHPWDMQIRNEGAYKRFLYEDILGLGESYMDGWWDCDALDQCIEKLVKGNIREKVKKNWKLAFRVVKAKLFNRQSKNRAYEVGKRHYDIGNDLYKAMLDERMLYTCGYWRGANTLAEAQAAKLELVCKKIGLKPGMNVLELGCGWGSFAKYAAEKYGATVTGVTVSKEQVELGNQMCRGLPVELRLQDYREVSGTYDAVISIGILEHVGYKNYRTYMETVDRCLRDDGIAFIHTIGGNKCMTDAGPWFDKYIFPNSMLPSIAQIGRAMNGLFVMEDWHNFGPDYDKTLMAWYHNFEDAWPALKHRYDERFYRMWKFYLLSCAGAFRSRDQQLWQIVMTKKGMAQPDCRVS
jgi:cyclopropane-fatty-acyl-phospholipid synthase